MFFDPFDLAARGSRMMSAIHTSTDGVRITRDKEEFQIPFQVERTALVEKIVETIYNNNHLSDTITILMALATTTVKGRNFFQSMDIVDSKLTNYSRDNFVKVIKDILATYKAPKIHANVLSVAETMEYLDKDAPELEAPVVTVTLETEPATTAAAEGLAYKRASELVGEFMVFADDLAIPVEKVTFDTLEPFIKKDAYTAAEGNDQYVPDFYKAVYSDCIKAIVENNGKTVKSDLLGELADYYMSAKFESLRMMLKVFILVNSKRGAAVNDLFSVATGEEGQKVNSVASAAKAVASRGARQLR